MVQVDGQTGVHNSICGTLANPTSVLVSHGTNRWGGQEYTIVPVVQVDRQTGVHDSICVTHPTSVLVSHGTNRHGMDRSVQVSVLQFGWTFSTPMAHVGMSLQLHRESQCPSEHLMTVLKYCESHCPSGHLKAILDIYVFQIQHFRWRLKTPFSKLHNCYADGMLIGIDNHIVIRYTVTVFRQGFNYSSN